MPDESNPPTPSDRGAHAARAWLEVDLAAVARNARRIAGRSGVPLLPMVKAQAYGLGAVPVARALEALAPWGYGVASVEEGRELRAAGIDRPILVATPLLDAELGAAHGAGLTPSLHRAPEIRQWARLGGPWHLGIDTGMARAGVRWDALDAELLDAIRAHPPEGAFTHFHSADADEASRAEQDARFRAALARLPERPRLVHAENSPAVERGRGPSGYDLVRPGVYLYGVSYAAAEPRMEAPEPVAHLRARIVDVRELRAGESVSYGATWRADGPRRIATVAAGYADGYRRALSGRGVALVGGCEAPVVGRVTMDMTMLDVTAAPCAVGDVATLVGADSGALLTVSDVAARGDLSPYELLVGLRLRVPHVYRDR